MKKAERCMVCGIKIVTDTQNDDYNSTKESLDRGLCGPCFQNLTNAEIEPGFKGSIKAALETGHKVSSVLLEVVYFASKMECQFDRGHSDDHECLACICSKIVRERDKETCDHERIQASFSVTTMDDGFVGAVFCADCNKKLSEDVYSVDGVIDIKPEHFESIGVIKPFNQK